MQELLQRVLAVLEHTGPGEFGEYVLGNAALELEVLKKQVEKVLDSGVFVGRVTAADLFDVPGAH